jgi:protease II
VTASPPAEPQAEQRPLERTLHDLRLIDEYAWLKAENWREVIRDPFQLDPAICAYLQAENDYCERALANTKSLQETLFAEMKGRIKEDGSSAPDPDGPYAYYVRYRKEGQHPLLCREPRNSLHLSSMQAADVKPEEQLLIDGDALERGKAFFRLGATRHSSDHRLLAWFADEASSPSRRVSKYMIRHREPPSQHWRTFLRNHAEAIAAIESDRGVARTTDRGGIPVEHGADLPGARQRWRLRAGLHKSRPGDGDSGPPDITEIAMAESIC